jgi:hypothetical protein
MQSTRPYSAEITVIAAPEVQKYRPYFNKTILTYVPSRS